MTLITSPLNISIITNNVGLQPRSQSSDNFIGDVGKELKSASKQGVTEGKYELSRTLTLELQTKLQKVAEALKTANYKEVCVQLEIHLYGGLNMTDIANRELNNIYQYLKDISQNSVDNNTRINSKFLISVFENNSEFSKEGVNQKSIIEQVRDPHHENYKPSGYHKPTNGSNGTTGDPHADDSFKDGPKKTGGLPEGTFKDNLILEKAGIKD